MRRQMVTTMYNNIKSTLDHLLKLPCSVATIRKSLSPWKSKYDQNIVIVSKQLDFSSRYLWCESRHGCGPGHRTCEWIITFFSLKTNLFVVQNFIDSPLHRQIENVKKTIFKNCTLLLWLLNIHSSIDSDVVTAFTIKKVINFYLCWSSHMVYNYMLLSMFRTQCIHIASVACVHNLHNNHSNNIVTQRHWNYCHVTWVVNKEITVQ